MKFRPYSFSKISVYDGCPKSFKYANIDKAPKDPQDPTALLKGGAVHSILEVYPDPSTHKYAPKHQYVVDNFLKTELGKKYLLTEKIAEYKFGLTDRLKPTSYSDKTALFRGKIDQVCHIDGVIYIIDWKTGKYKEERWQNFNQLMYYAIFFFQKYSKIDTLKITYVYVEHKDMENYLIMERKYLPNYVKQLVELISKLENDTEFVKKPSPLCKWCSFYTHCQDN